MAEPKRLRILRAMKTLAEVITVANGYASNAGQHVHLGRLRVGPREDLAAVLPALVLNPGRTETPAQGRAAQIRLPVIWQGLVIEDLDDPVAEAEIVVGDVKRALFAPGVDATLGGLAVDLEMGEVEPVPREDGSRVMGLQVEALVTYVETRGAPDA